MISGFSVVWSERGLMLSGLANTVVLSLLAGLCSLLLGALLSTLLTRQSGVLKRAARVFVDAMRCTPFLLFVYIVYYGLPSLGMRFDNWQAGLAALTVYHTAYMGEVLRAAWVAQPHAPIEAGQAFGYSGLRLFRRIIFPPMALASAPVIGNQVIQVIKDSAFLTIIALPELTHAASSIQSRHYVPFAAFISAVLLYWALCLVIEAGVSSVGRMAEARR
jgi:polar amino acid transport system permease protein